MKFKIRDIQTILGVIVTVVIVVSSVYAIRANKLIIKDRIKK